MKPLTSSPVPKEGAALLPPSAITRIDEGKRDKEVITPMRQDTQGAQEGLSTVRCGNAFADGARHHGWFIGRFLKIPHDLRSSDAVEVKWSTHHAGAQKQLWGMSEEATTLCVLIRGNVSLQFPGMECVLSQEGDYALWSAGVPHRWAVAQESLVLTVRWPSAPETY